MMERGEERGEREREREKIAMHSPPPHTSFTPNLQNLQNNMSNNQCVEAICTPVIAVAFDCGMIYGMERSISWPCMTHNSIK